MHRGYELIAFMRIADGMNYLADVLTPIPLEWIKSWLASIHDVRDLTPQQQAMKQLHIEVITAYIKAREFAENDSIEKAKNN